MIKKLKNHKYAQCHIEFENNKVVFVSYSTAVIFITRRNGKRYVECTGTYSQTTRKQIGYFLKEYLPQFSYYDMKNIVGKGEIQI